MATAAVAGWLFLHRDGAVRPALLARGQFRPAHVTAAAGTWYWLDPVDPPYRTLHRASGSGAPPQEIASADALAGYAVSAGRVAWTAREGARWSVYVANADGSNRRAVWTGDGPGPPHLASDRVWWTAPVAGPAVDPGPFPMRERKLAVMCAPLEGGSAETVARLLESGEGEVVGSTPDTVYVAAFRTEPPVQTALYAVPLSGGLPRRIAGDAGHAAPLMRADGSLWWTCNSRESNNPNFECTVRRWSPTEGARTVQDWLPSPGRLYDVDGEIVYVSADFRPAVWSLVGPAGIPALNRPPPGYYPVGVGPGGVLLRRARDNRGGPLYVIGTRP